MKLIKAVIRPERLEFVKKALEDRGIFGMTCMEVMGRGEQKGIALKYRRSTMTIEFIPKVCIEVVIKDEDAARVLDAIIGAGRTGKIGDGRIFVIPVERSIRVRTGEEMQG
ncbi:MAG: P-II family nitrogen regulator [Methanomicrobiales archaeon]|nr:P-II family nitrogen regulator [Methanomicrobiales archaeon]